MRGAWIEIWMVAGDFADMVSLPVRGAWIEMRLWIPSESETACRSPCGERGLKLLRRVS